jgi:hypothetical protein
VNAVLVERVPAGALGALAVALHVGLTGSLVDHVMLAGDIVALETELADHLGGIVEFLVLRQVGDVASVDQEGRLGLQALHLGDRILEGGERIRVGGQVEADVAVGKLQKGQPTLGSLDVTQERRGGMPPEIVHRTPVPAQSMHSSAPRRSTIGPSSFLSCSGVISISGCWKLATALAG